MIGSEQESIRVARVAVLASDEVSRALVKALSALSAAEIRPLAWPALTLTATPAPDMVVCEIREGRQAEDHRRELGRLWPGALLVSCEPNTNGLPEVATELDTASREAGYHGHVLLDEAALQLPFFLRYAEQRRKADTQLARLERLLNAVSRMHASLDQQCVASAVLNEFQQWVGADSWLLYTISDDNRFLELALSEGVRTRPQSLTLAVNGPGLIERALQQGEIAVINQSVDAGAERAASRKRTAGAVLCLPLIVEGNAVGVVEAIRNEESGTFDALDEQMLRELSRIASTALNNAQRFARTERLYMQDDLTRLYNSRFLRQFLENEIRRARRYGSPVSVAFIDLDGFKQVNDRYGHRVGSETLKEVAELFLGAVRETDIVARYGGDEFTIVLPETTADQAFATAERIRQRLAAQRFSGGSGESFHITASFGVAACPDHAQAAPDLIERADLAMYQAKATNKNNVKLAE
jgi:diguanylate cyclase (GGDEF)-like protein